jgi:hypothetical protein
MLILILLYVNRISVGLLRLQQIYQSLKPGAESFQVEMVKRIQNASEAIEFLHSIEELSRSVVQCKEDSERLRGYRVPPQQRGSEQVSGTVLQCEEDSERLRGYRVPPQHRGAEQASGTV